MSTTPDQLETQIVSVPERARVLIITTGEDYVQAGELLKVVKALRAEVDATFDPIIGKAHEAHKEAIAQKRKVEAPLAEAEGILKPRIAFYLTEQERIRREDELRLQRQADEEAAARQLENAAILDSLGETEEANALLAEPLQKAPPVILPRSVPKVSGISSHVTWDFDVIDVNKIPREYMIPDLVKIRRMVNALRAQTNIPGIRVKKTTGISAGRR